jgi:hypothetical protein
MLLTSTINTRQLALNVTYGGAPGLNETMYIDVLTLYFDGHASTTVLENSIEIKGPLKIVIPING